MRLSALTEEMVDKAVSIYQDLAYGSIVPRKRSPPLGDADGVLGRFHRDNIEAVAGHPCSRYSMRLGNRNYPFMKLVVQEHLIAGEFFFAVDTHDQMELGSEFPDSEQWVAVRKFNSALKRRIEESFEQVGLDTAAVVRRLVVENSEDQGRPFRGLVLIVDDEEDLAVALEALIQRSGFRTCKVQDGRSGVVAARELMPDLVILDYELPELDGLQVIDYLRADERTRNVPILLNSSASMSMIDIQKADGFLSKPFPESLLNEMLARVLKKRPGRGARDERSSVDNATKRKASSDNGGATP